MQQRQSGDSLSGLSAQAQQMLQQQKDFANRLRETTSKNGNSASADSDSTGQRRYGYGGRWNRDPYDPTRRAMPSSRTQQTDQLASEKEKMAEQLEQLQRDVQRQAQRMSGEQPDASSKLREALNGIQQQDLAAHMKKNADWIRQGYGAEAWVNEQSATLALDQFNKQMQEARASAENAQNGTPGQRGGESSRALQQVEELKRQLSQQAAQPGQQNRGGGMMPGGRPAIAEAMQGLATLRQQLAPRSGRAYYDSEYAFRYLQDLEGADPNELSRRLNSEVLPTLERLEVDLKREAKTQPEGGRVAASETAPDTYKDAVAEYFKRLSK
jgi:hypothetical protein